MWTKSLSGFLLGELSVQIQHFITLNGEGTYRVGTDQYVQLCMDVCMYVCRAVIQVGVSTTLYFYSANVTIQSKTLFSIALFIE